MGRLIVVSNRTSAGSPKAGGLAVALTEALVQAQGLWVGWSGKVVDEAPRGMNMFYEDGVEFALTDYTDEEHEGFYLGYANRALWPVLHYRTDLAYFDEQEFAVYADVNARYAKLITPRLRGDDVLWVQDYHFFMLGHNLRDHGFEGRMGFFLHVPFPPPEIVMTIPDHAQLFRAMCAYDVIGVQTNMDRRNLEQYLCDQFGAKPDGEGDFLVQGRTVKVRAYPIGIEAQEFERMAREPEAEAAAQKTARLLGDRALILGVDRMDYSKGIPNRFEAVGRLLDHYPELRGKISYTQVAPPSRSKVEEYRDLREELDQLAGRVNGDYGDLDWIPIRYLARSYPREQLAGIFRLARVCLVTPLHDGMNLVAKEYIAAQDPDDPGVLILSQFAGAAEQLGQGAVIVNPHDKSGMADAMKTALEMPLAERQRRYEICLQPIREQNISWWRETFLNDLMIDQDNGDGHVVAMKKA